MKRDTLLNIWRTQRFLVGEQYAVYDQDIGGAPTYALFRKRDLPEGLTVDHVMPKERHRILRPLYWTAREYKHAWQVHLAKPVECGCSEFHGRTMIYCSGDHLIRELGRKDGA